MYSKVVERCSTSVGVVSNCKQKAVVKRPTEAEMRWNAKSGYDEYAIFSKNWLSEVKKYEPRIEEMLEYIMDSYWANYWDTNEIRRRLK